MRAGICRADACGHTDRYNLMDVFKLDLWSVGLVLSMCKLQRVSAVCMHSEACICLWKAEKGCALSKGWRLHAEPAGIKFMRLCSFN